MSLLAKYDFLKHLPRAVGPTSAAIRGVAPMGGWVIVSSQAEASLLNRKHCAEAITPSNMCYRVVATDRPIIMDIQAVRNMQADYEREINRLKELLEYNDRVVSNVRRAIGY